MFEKTFMIEDKAQIGRGGKESDRQLFHTHHVILKDPC